MSQTDPYFQFPIGMLRDSGGTAKLCQEIIDYALWNYALSLQTELPRALWQVAAADYLEKHEGAGKGFDPSNHSHLLLCAAAGRLKVRLLQIPSVLGNGQKLKEQFGSVGTQCRLRTDILWSAHDEPWCELKFRVLCAVYAGIGNRHFITLNHRMIQALGAGHNSPKGLTVKDMLPRSSVRYWLEELWYDNFFQFCKQGARRWYSHSLPDDQSLANSVRALQQLQPRGERRSKRLIEVADGTPL